MAFRGQANKPVRILAPARLLFAIAVLAAITGRQTAKALETAPMAVQDVTNAISCNQAFEPESLLERLQRLAFIGPVPLAVKDGGPLFKVVKPLKLLGLNVKFVTAWDSSGRLFSFPGGAVTGKLFEIVVDGDAKSVESKIGSKFLKQDDRFHSFLSDSPTFSKYFAHGKSGAMTAMTCVDSFLR